jgi:hypothetical protein
MLTMGAWNELGPKQAMEMFSRRGQGRQVRLEFEMLTVMDVQQIGRELSEIGRKLSAIGKQTDMPPFERLVLARHAIYNFPRSDARRRSRTRREPDDA